jgi:hypothetical protein
VNSKERVYFITGRLSDWRREARHDTAVCQNSWDPSAGGRNSIDREKGWKDDIQVGDEIVTLCSCAELKGVVLASEGTAGRLYISEKGA